MDKLDDIFKKQAELDAYLDAKRGFTAQYSREDWVQKKCLALMDELGELLDEVNYKWWKNPKPIDKNAVAEELVDILHFWVSMCIDMDLSADDVYKTYLAKNRANKDRQEGKTVKTGYCADKAD